MSNYVSGAGCNIDVEGINIYEKFEEGMVGKKIS